jgi:hypothetical protein
MSTEGKIFAAIIAIYLYFHWQGLQGALASGLTGAAGNTVPGNNTTGGNFLAPAVGNSPPRAMPIFTETWGTGAY